MACKQVKLNRKMAAKASRMAKGNESVIGNTDRIMRDAKNLFHRSKRGVIYSASCKGAR